MKTIDEVIKRFEPGDLGFCVDIKNPNDPRNIGTVQEITDACREDGYESTCMFSGRYFLFEPIVVIRARAEMAQDRERR